MSPTWAKPDVTKLKHLRAAVANLQAIALKEQERLRQKAEGLKKLAGKNE